VIVILEGVQAAGSNPTEAALVARLVAALRDGLRDQGGQPYSDDATFFKEGVFVVSPHRAQNRAIRHELDRLREWASRPFVDTVDKMQGQEADAVVISYGVSDPEYALREAEFIYNVNRLNVAITRGRTKSIVCLPRPLLDATPAVLEQPEAARGLAFMRRLVQGVQIQGQGITFTIEQGIQARVYRASQLLAPDSW
jgi:DNA replication ATP-dependent helicase Dna2